VIREVNHRNTPSQRFLIVFAALIIGTIRLWVARTVARLLERSAWKVLVCSAVRFQSFLSHT